MRSLFYYMLISGLNGFIIQNDNMATLNNWPLILYAEVSAYGQCIRLGNYNACGTCSTAQGFIKQTITNAAEYTNFNFQWWWSTVGNTETDKCIFYYHYDNDADISLAEKGETQGMTQVTDVNLDNPDSKNNLTIMFKQSDVEGSEYCFIDEFYIAPTNVPTDIPTVSPTYNPTVEPTSYIYIPIEPTLEPTLDPANIPSFEVVNVQSTELGSSEDETDSVDFIKYLK